MTFTQMGTAGQRAFSELGIGGSQAGKRAIEVRIWPSADHPGVRFLEWSRGIRVLPI